MSMRNRQGRSLTGYGSKSGLNWSMAPKVPSLDSLLYLVFRRVALYKPQRAQRVVSSLLWGVSNCFYYGECRNEISLLVVLLRRRCLFN
jgi:hypothetical protein